MKDVKDSERGSRLHLILENSEHRSDIVFIHGLGGHWKETWLNPESGFYWPDALARQFSYSKVWSLEYEVAPTRWTGNALPLFDRAVEVLDLFRSKQIGFQPLCLITHSMGGLLGKTMLRHAFEAQVEYGFFSKGLVGLEFICTPHTGSNLAALADFLSFCLRGTVALEELKRCAPQLRSLNQFYRTNAESLGICTRAFYETEPVSNIVIVPADIADPGILNVTPIPVPRDHFGVPKPPNDQDAFWLSTNQFLQEAFHQQDHEQQAFAQTSVEEKPPASSPLHESENPNFKNVVSFLRIHEQILIFLSETIGMPKDLRQVAERLLTPLTAADMIEKLCIEAVKGDSGKLGNALIDKAGELVFLCVSSLLSQKAIDDLRKTMNAKQLCTVGVGDSILLEIAIKAALRAKPEFTVEPHHIPVGRQRIPLSGRENGRESGPMDTTTWYEQKFKDFALDKYKTGNPMSYDLDSVAKSLARFFRGSDKPFYYEFGAHDEPNKKALSAVLSKFDGLQAYAHDLNAHMMIGIEYQERIFVALCELISTLKHG